MVTKLEQHARAAIRAWCAKQKVGLREISAVYPRTYVVGHAAPRCLIVSQCWADGKEHMREFLRENPLKNVHLFDESLKAGDWCISAYICHPGVGETIAIPLEAPF